MLPVDLRSLLQCNSVPVAFGENRNGHTQVDGAQCSSPEKDLARYIREKVDPYIKMIDMHPIVHFDLDEFKREVTRGIPGFLEHIMKDPKVRTEMEQVRERLQGNQVAAVLARSERESSKVVNTIAGMGYLAPGVFVAGSKCKPGAELNHFDAAAGVVAYSKARDMQGCTDIRALIRNLQDERAGIVADTPGSPYVLSLGGDVIVTVKDPLTGQITALHKPKEGESKEETKTRQLLLFSTLFRDPTSLFEVHINFGEAVCLFRMPEYDPALEKSKPKKNGSNKRVIWPIEEDTPVKGVVFRTRHQLLMTPLLPEEILSMEINPFANGGFESEHPIARRHILLVDNLLAADPANAAYMFMKDMAVLGSAPHRYWVIKAALDKLDYDVKKRGSCVVQRFANTDFVGDDVDDLEESLANRLQLMFKRATGVAEHKRKKRN